MDERRKFVRLSEVWPLKYKITNKAAGKLRSRTVNVSAGGVRFYTNAILKKGTLLEIELFIPAQTSPFYVKGRVIWQGRVIWCKESSDKDKWPLEVGVEFTDIDPYDRERLYSYIKNCLKNKK